MIIGHNLCPYTKAVRRRAGALDCDVTPARSSADVLATVSSALRRIGTGPAETALVVVAPAPGATWNDEVQRSFAAFLSLGWQVEAHLEEHRVAASECEEGGALAVQIALFHPLAVRSLYACGEEEEAADYAMRSPFPTVHLLRSADVAAVPVASAEAVPERNRNRLVGMGLEQLRAELQALRTRA